MNDAGTCRTHPHERLTAMNELNYLPGLPAAELLEIAISALRVELASQGCPEIVIERTAAWMRRGFDSTRAWLQRPEGGATPVRRFGCFRAR